MFPVLLIDPLPRTTSTVLPQAYMFFSRKINFNVLWSLQRWPASLGFEENKSVPFLFFSKRPQ